MTIMMPVRKRIPSHLQFIYQRTPRPTRKISSEVAPHNPLPPPKQASRSQSVLFFTSTPSLAPHAWWDRSIHSVSGSIIFESLWICTF